jgi:sirohydrochlorin ferrochelatase
MSVACSSTSVMTAALLIAHGSRRAEANADLSHLADRIAATGEYAIVEVGFLELTEPSIVAGGRACVARGAQSVRMLPYFLSAGVHVTDDLTAAREALAAEFPTVAFTLCPPLGLHPLMTQIVLERLRESGE